MFPALSSTFTKNWDSFLKNFVKSFAINVGLILMEQLFEDFSYSSSPLNFTLITYSPEFKLMLIVAIPSEFVVLT